MVSDVIEGHVGTADLILQAGNQASSARYVPLKIQTADFLQTVRARADCARSIPLIVHCLAGELLRY